MLRQAEQLEWEEFVSVYQTVLDEYKILPSTSVEDFVNKVGNLVAQNEDLERVMRQGAQSISMYITEKDANSPMDLLMAIHFVENNEQSFNQI